LFGLRGGKQAKRRSEPTLFFFFDGKSKEKFQKFTYISEPLQVKFFSFL
jgi:hypothetical protein